MNGNPFDKSYCSSTSSCYPSSQSETINKETKSIASSKNSKKKVRIKKTSKSSGSNFLGSNLAASLNAVTPVLTTEKVQVHYDDISATSDPPHFTPYHIKEKKNSYLTFDTSGNFNSASILASLPSHSLGKTGRDSEKFNLISVYPIKPTVNSSGDSNLASMTDTLPPKPLCKKTLKTQKNKDLNISYKKDLLLFPPQEENDKETIPYHCWYCNQTIQPEVRFERKQKAWIWFWFLLFLLMWPFCLLPLLLKKCREPVHYCIFCNNRLTPASEWSLSGDSSMTSDTHKSQQ